MRSLSEKSSERIIGVIFGLLLLSYAFSGVNNYRLQPILSTIMQTYSVNESQVGVLMSAITLVSLFLTIPTGFLLLKMNHCLAMTLSMTCQLAGLLLAKISGSFQGILVSQILLGLANTFMGVCVPSFMQLIFDAEKYAARFGYANAFQNLGMAVAFLSIPRIIANGNFYNAWTWFLIPTAVLILAWIVMILVARRNGIACSTKNPDRGKQDRGAVRGVMPLLDIRLWILTFSVLCTMISSGAALNYSALYLTEVKGFSQTAAANMTFSFAISGMVICAATGKICSIFGKKRVYIGIILLLTVLKVLPVLTNNPILLTIITTMHGVPAACVVIAIGTVPQLCEAEKYRPVAVSMLSTACTGGLALSSLLFGKLITITGFDRAFYCFIPISVAALVGVFVIDNKKRDKGENL